MRFISGPRQAGKTTLAQVKLDQVKSRELYYLWDRREVKQRFKENELFFTEDALKLGISKKHWVCFDEIHKLPKWKNILKAVFDETGDRYNFIVTGSAKLDVIKRAGDSLAGRYFTFHLMPLTLNELSTAARSSSSPPETARHFLDDVLNRTPVGQGDLDSLLEFSGFPEPFLRASRPFHKKWARNYAETVINEDIGSLTRIVDREYIYDLYSLLPDMVGNPLSQSSLASHLGISPTTVKNYLRRLEDFYLAFSIRPYSKNIKRSLLKAGKYYLYDWTRITTPGERFENFVACEVRARLLLWSDATGDSYQLYYIRNKQKQETDFLIVKNKKPWLLLEAKLSDGSVARHHQETIQAVGNVPFVQVCQAPGVLSLQKKNIYRISANRIFG